VQCGEGLERGGVAVFRARRAVNALQDLVESLVRLAFRHGVIVALTEVLVNETLTCYKRSVHRP